MSTAKNSAFSCLIVDDDPAFVSMVEQIVREEGGAPTCCGSVREARRQIDAQPFDIACLDNKLPDGTGFEFHAQLSQRCPGCVSIMITGAPELSQAVELTRNGLFDYLTKPLTLAEVAACLKRARRRLAHPSGAPDADEMIGDSPANRETIHLLRQAARHPTATVLLHGETGTGKDLAARLLHRWTVADGARLGQYIPVNCPAVPAEMFEAELFGSEKGAYTGADRRRAGLVEAAEGGTLFLDEVTEIPLQLQSKLLRFLESREYRPLGGTLTRRFSGRVVAATNRSLHDEVHRGRFREDLMFRLDVSSIRLPPLRERLADIPRLTDFLLGQLCAKYERRKPQLVPADTQALCGYRFPGNVRELRNLIERSLLRSADDAMWLQLDLGWLRHSAPGPSVAATPPAAARADLSALEEQEYQLIQRTLREEGGAIRRTATRLGLTHQALLRRLQKWPELRHDLNG